MRAPMFNDPIAESVFTSIPNTLICNPDVSPLAKAVYMVARFVLKHTEKVEVREVANALCEGESDVRDALKELDKEGYITLDLDEDGARND